MSAILFCSFTKTMRQPCRFIIEERAGKKRIGKKCLLPATPSKENCIFANSQINQTRFSKKRQSSDGDIWSFAKI